MQHSASGEGQERGRDSGAERQTATEAHRDGDAKREEGLKHKETGTKTQRH